MPAVKRPCIEPTDDWQQLYLGEKDWGGECPKFGQRREEDGAVQSLDSGG